MCNVRRWCVWAPTCLSPSSAPSMCKPSIWINGPRRMLHKTLRHRVAVCATIATVLRGMSTKCFLCITPATPLLFDTPLHIAGVKVPTESSDPLSLSQLLDDAPPEENMIELSPDAHKQLQVCPH